VLGGAWLVAARYETLGGILIAVAVFALLGHAALEAYRSFRRKS